MSRESAIVISSVNGSRLVICTFGFWRSGGTGENDGNGVTAEWLGPGWDIDRS